MAEGYGCGPKEGRKVKKMERLPVSDGWHNSSEQDGCGSGKYCEQKMQCKYLQRSERVNKVDGSWFQLMEREVSISLEQGRRAKRTRRTVESFLQLGQFLLNPLPEWKLKFPLCHTLLIRSHNNESCCLKVETQCNTHLQNQEILVLP